MQASVVQCLEERTQQAIVVVFRKLPSVRKTVREREITLQVRNFLAVIFRPRFKKKGFGLLHLILSVTGEVIISPTEIIIKQTMYCSKNWIIVLWNNQAGIDRTLCHIIVKKEPNSRFRHIHYNSSHLSKQQNHLHDS